MLSIHTWDNEAVERLEMKLILLFLVPLSSNYFFYKCITLASFGFLPQNRYKVKDAEVALLLGTIK